VREWREEFERDQNTGTRTISTVTDIINKIVADNQKRR
jgi:hypothetical protein